MIVGQTGAERLKNIFGQYITKRYYLEGDDKAWILADQLINGDLDLSFDTVQTQKKWWGETLTVTFDVACNQNGKEERRKLNLTEVQLSKLQGMFSSSATTVSGYMKCQPKFAVGRHFVDTETVAGRNAQALLAAQEHIGEMRFG